MEQHKRLIVMNWMLFHCLYLGGLQSRVQSEAHQYSFLVLNEGLLVLEGVELILILFIRNRVWSHLEQNVPSFQEVLGVPVEKDIFDVIFPQYCIFYIL